MIVLEFFNEEEGVWDRPLFFVSSLYEENSVPRKHRVYEFNLVRVHVYL